MKCLTLEKFQIPIGLHQKQFLEDIVKEAKERK